MAVQICQMFFAEASEIIFVEAAALNKGADFFAANVVGHHHIAGAKLI